MDTLTHWAAWRVWGQGGQARSVANRRGIDAKRGAAFRDGEVVWVAQDAIRERPD